MKKAYFTFLITGLTILSVYSGANNEESRMETYEMETVYSAEYKGFISADGNIWDYDGTYEDGETYTFVMSDNGTKGKIEDDIMIRLL